MGEIKNQFELYRERICKIDNKNIEIENLIINGIKEDDERIKKLKLDIKKLELENKKIDNILKLLPEKDYKVISLIYIQGKEKKKVARELDRTKRQIDYSINKALIRISKGLIE
ncbi:RNA polymerase subunit sigma-70 [Clostridium beijerinckii]|uniref:RNA polymerase subunit sigma-70 n=1 Tax=Clostridium beijerinckii TaxID=1520 RepID=A0AAW3WAC1_CLOBE|nr:RNA polymerase subunit sigma-70 [Clostridium beijerinckii]MBC2456143.1 RNA polymerase subunit sigma-70 [Clostridium beijerinckii]MBC2475428.1 RNA polymerase subunit sigma-70 [Clostridium beijerinckii]NOV63463.1 DNA-directed RNA polymerase specialized sigma subunit [Clostridium beijerinckii]NOV69571.1 DNA-directed RNA polymerase specialized sigma subunit [Clostridium beijerinckii]NOW31520.1 DNA-directed RNA polymerase specialized sigma subunit [Clostridium beijerinckii]